MALMRRGVVTSLALAVCAISTYAGAQPADDPAGDPPDDTTVPSDPAAPDEPTDDAAEPEVKKVDPGDEDEKRRSESTAPAAATDGGNKRSSEAAPVAEAEDKPHVGQFSFGSYGRMIAASDSEGRPGRDADIVAHGSRFDHSNYVELELRREDHWDKVDADTRFVATLAISNPIFHYDGEFDIAMAVRNLYLEERDLGLKGLSMWVGSRMLRGDDIYLLDWWPLDNLNTMGGGVRYDAATKTHVQLHFGLGQPSNPFYLQEAERPAPLNQFGSATVKILDRQQWVGSLKVEQDFDIGAKGGLKIAGYSEAHGVPAAQRETETTDVYEDIPSDNGFVIGAQLGGWTGERDTHVNLFLRYSTGLAAYGEFASPDQLSSEQTASGAHELSIAAATNFEAGPFAGMIAAYFRSFRNASEALDFGDIDEGMFIARPQIFFADWAGFALEGSFQMQQRGVLADLTDEEQTGEPETVVAHVGRLGLMPFVVPAGPGSFSRPMLYLFYMATFRDQAARALYPDDDVFGIREVDHLFGLGAEWWFGSTSYGGE